MRQQARRLLESTRNGIGEGHSGGKRETDADVQVRRVETVRAVDRAAWNGVVEASTCGTVFHRWEWLAAVEDGLDYEPRHLLVCKDSNLVGLCPAVVAPLFRSIFADLPWTPLKRLSSIEPEFGNPLATTDRAETLTAMLEAVPDLCGGRTVVHEIRAGRRRALRDAALFSAHGYRPVRRECRFQLDLRTGYDAIRAGMSGSRRNAIDHAREAGHEVVEEPITEASLRRWYRVYERHVERVGGVAYPYAFVRALQGVSDRLLLLTARIDGEYAGGFLEVLDDERSTVHGFLAAVPERYYADGATELLYDHVLRWGIDNGYRTYDFGGSPPDFENGVFRFKEGFGGRLVPTLLWEGGCGPAWPLIDAARTTYERRIR